MEPTTQPEWHAAVTKVWSGAKRRDADEVLREIQGLVAGHEAEPLAAFELACALDHAGREEEAEAPYRRALAAGLDRDHHQQAVIQLASTLRNLGRLNEAADLLWAELDGELTAPYTAAACAFLALTLLDLGEDRRAAVVALEGLAESLTVYREPVTRYVEDVVGEEDLHHQDEPDVGVVHNG